MERWIKSGENWMWATWVGDSQVIYLLHQDGDEWQVCKKVSGAGDPCGYVVDTSGDLTIAKGLAMEDSEKPL